jgi:hypothetical protein
LTDCPTADDNRCDHLPVLCLLAPRCPRKQVQRLQEQSRKRRSWRHTQWNVRRKDKP